MIQNEAFKYSLFQSINSEFNMNVSIKGTSKQVLDTMIKQGYASTQSEAIRLALFWFDQSKLNQNELAVKKITKIHKEIKKGKRKTLSLKQVTKTNPEFKELI